jgi:hypothetical protein
MPLDPVVNFFQSQIATLPVSDVATTIVITTNDGNKLPNPASSGAFNLTIFKDGDPFTDPEIVRVTAKSGDTLTVTRGQEGTIPSTKGASDVWKVVMFPTAKMITDIDSLKVNKAGDTMTGTLSATKLIPTGGTATGNGMYLPSTNTLAFSTNGSERMRLLSNGNLLIGTTDNSGDRLRVDGSVRANNFYTSETTTTVATATWVTVYSFASDVSVNSRFCGKIFIRDNGGTTMGAFAEFVRFTDGNSQFIRLFNTQVGEIGSEIRLSGSNIQFRHNLGSSRTIRTTTVFMINDER